MELCVLCVCVCVRCMERCGPTTTTATIVMLMATGVCVVDALALWPNTMFEPWSNMLFLIQRLWFKVCTRLYTNDVWHGVWRLFSYCFMLVVFFLFFCFWLLCCVLFYFIFFFLCLSSYDECKTGTRFGVFYWFLWYTHCHCVYLKWCVKWIGGV